ncbi:hypothetical protein Bpfe_011267 [Biomphalaria pfeifferi]|uniref:Uncharacterized protein n=1 Tax=Biomphalaria pfeifferi TaxID=112525 RepID=A0AAD8BRE4_BIOPF|nr:hypothetical protein Bpfe_011267 [Biomphalaria pfeifferi]
MPVIRVNCNSTNNNGTVQFIINVSQTLTEANSTNIHDSEGALRFTIAVVLVYGIGVIGLLGISARRNRRMEAMDKEVNKFIKSKLSKYEERKTRRPKTINKLISSLHSIIQTEESLHTVMTKSGQSHAKKNFPLKKAYTWSSRTQESFDPLGLQLHINSCKEPNRSAVFKSISQNKSLEETLPLNTPSQKKVTCTKMDSTESMLVSSV